MHGINVIGYIDLGAHVLWVLFFGQELHMEVGGGYEFVDEVGIHRRGYQVVGYTCG